MCSTGHRQPGDIVNDVYSEHVQSIVQMCLDAGDDPSSLIEQVKHELQKMVAEMMAEDDGLLERKRAELTPLRARFECLYHELHPEKISPDYASGVPVLPALRRYVDEYKRLKEEHEKLLEREPDIRREERQLSNELNERSLQTDNSTLNGKQLITQISLLSEHIQQMREEKSKRLAHLVDLIRTLHDFEEGYGWKRPTNETMIGRLLTLGPSQLDQFTLSKEALELVDKEFLQINDQLNKAETHFEASHKTLQKLMRKHQSLIPTDKALAVTQNKQCRLSKLPDLIAEVDRYTEHALDKLTDDILKRRERIHLILNKLSVTDVNNHSKYAVLFTNEFTEDVYFMHEELLQDLEAQYEMNRSIYEQIETWNELFLEFQHFEKDACDPQRFHRRGYSALAEEKKRKKLDGALRECEGRLDRLADDFRTKHQGQSFIMNANGKEIAEFISERKEEYTRGKEREREAAKAAHGMTSGTVIGRTPLKNKQLVGATPSAASKRCDQSSHLRTPLTTARRGGLPHLPTGKTPLNNSVRRTRGQTMQQAHPTKRQHLDLTSSTIGTPVKQRRLIDPMINPTSQTATPSGPRPLTKRAIPTPIRTHR